MISFLKPTLVFAVTAAGPRENSWAVYCIGNNDTDEICLGDEFSVTWIEDQADQVIFFVF